MNMQTFMSANPHSCVASTLHVASHCITQLALPTPALGGMHCHSTWTMITPTSPLMVSVITLGLAWFGSVSAFVPTSAKATSYPLQIRSELAPSAARVNRAHQQQRCGASAVSTATMAGDSVVEVKSKILQLAAVMDRGGMANPGVSNAYCGTKDDMRRLVETLAELEPLDKPLTAGQLSGRWELAYTTVELFRASPFFQMVEAGYDNPEKSNLFFKLHQLQTGSWGASSIGRITQTLDLIDSVPHSVEILGDEESAEAEGEGEGGTTALEATSGGGSGSLESEVDLIILPLTSVPLVGFWKLLPTFGGCIATRASCVLTGNNNEVVELTVESTKLKAVEDVPLLPLVGSFFEGKDFPTGDAAKMVMGNVPVTKQTVVYVDGGLRVMRDKAGELYIYVRPLESY